MHFDQLSSIDELYVVCECMDVRFGDIIKAIKAGACDLESLMDATDAGTGCGKCKSPEDDPLDERAIHLTEILALAKAEGLCEESEEKGS